jgi:hypothetical protein
MDGRKTMTDKEIDDIAESGRCSYTVSLGDYFRIKEAIYIKKNKLPEGVYRFWPIINVRDDGKKERTTEKL